MTCPGLAVNGAEHPDDRGCSRTRARASWLVLLVPILACASVESGTDPEALGYGPGAKASLASGYPSDPVPRPAVTPWTPPARELAYQFDSSTTPSPEPIPYNADLIAVCTHLESIAELALSPEVCLPRYQVERVFRSIVDWKTLSACLEASASAKAVAVCEAATPRVFATIAEHARESEVCMHIFALTILEQLGSEPMLDVAHLGEFEELLHECVRSLVEDERADRKPADYVDMLTCMQTTRTTAAAEACE